MTPAERWAGTVTKWLSQVPAFIDITEPDDEHGNPAEGVSLGEGPIRMTTGSALTPGGYISTTHFNDAELIYAEVSKIHVNTDPLPRAEALRRFKIKTAATLRRQPAGTWLQLQPLGMIAGQIALMDKETGEELAVYTVAQRAVFVDEAGMEV